MKLSQVSKRADINTVSYLVTHFPFTQPIYIVGIGAQPTLTSTVTVHYHGTLTDGTVFDSSVARGEPIKFPLTNVIKGWQEGVAMMRAGGKATLVIPSDLAYVSIILLHTECHPSFLLIYIDTIIDPYSLTHPLEYLQITTFSTYTQTCTLSEPYRAIKDHRQSFHQEPLFCLKWN